MSNLSPQHLNTVIPMVGATLLTPLVGLIGAVLGFYYGGQTAVQAASQTAEATKNAAQAARAVQSATAAQMIAQTRYGGRPNVNSRRVGPAASDPGSAIERDAAARPLVS